MTDVPVHRRPGRVPSYDRFPTVPGGARDECVVGWDAIAGALRSTGARVVVVEAAPGVRPADLRALAGALAPDLVVDATDAMKGRREIDALLAPELGDDPVFGRLTRLEIDGFFDPAAVERERRRIAAEQGRVLVYGAGASLLARGDLLVHADMPRWEAQLRMRGGEFRNLGAGAQDDRWQLRYKRAYFVDWRVCDRLRKRLWNRMGFVLDTVGEPAMIPAAVMFAALDRAARRPFRVVPSFDPAPWGGRWMKQVCGLPADAPNYGWCFDCVPEENSLLLAFGDRRFEIPAANLVFRHPKELLGEPVYARFGDEFPIRFDLLDTVEGSTLSLQVHPLTEYIQERFGMHYTQDESYYVLDAEPEGHVYLGVRQAVDRDAMLAALRAAQEGGPPFDAERYVNRFPARRHDHFLIPAGTIHCSSRCIVLEISATPYIFTFKLWDWDRPGLDGLPRPVHIDHGERVIRWERDTAYARSRLINRVWAVAEGDGWVEERTGLHEAEFIETRRHWFTGAAPHPALDRVCVLNLVEGEEAVVESPDRAFDPFVVHYAETFIVPAAAGPFTVRPLRDERCATIKAFVRTEP